MFPKWFSPKALIFDLFTFGCYSGYMNIKRLEELHKHHQIKKAWTTQPLTLCSSCRSGR